VKEKSKLFIQYFTILLNRICIVCSVETIFHACSPCQSPVPKELGRCSCWSKSEPQSGRDILYSH